MEGSVPPLLLLQFNHYWCNFDDVLALQDENYGKLVIGALRSSGILCLGLYRKMYLDVSHSNHNRYVITNPSAETQLFPSDQV